MTPDRPHAGTTRKTLSDRLEGDSPKKQNKQVNIKSDDLYKKKQVKTFKRKVQKNNKQFLI